MRVPMTSPAASPSANQNHARADHRSVALLSHQAFKRVLLKPSGSSGLPGARATHSPRMAPKETFLWPRLRCFSLFDLAVHRAHDLVLTSPRPPGRLLSPEVRPGDMGPTPSHPQKPGSSFGMGFMALRLPPQSPKAWCNPSWELWSSASCCDPDYQTSPPAPHLWSDSSLSAPQWSGWVGNRSKI